MSDVGGQGSPRIVEGNPSQENSAAVVDSVLSTLDAPPSSTNIEGLSNELETTSSIACDSETIAEVALSSASTERVSSELEITTSIAHDCKTTADIAPELPIPDIPGPVAALDSCVAVSHSPSPPASPEMQTVDVVHISTQMSLRPPADNVDKPQSISAPDKPKARSAVWRKILLGSGGSREPSFSEWRCELNEPNQRVIHADCERTRAGEAFFREPEVRQKMEAMLTCWCKQQGVRYKQGLNEVLAPFMHLQTEPDDTAPSDDEVFACFAAFLRRFAPLFESEDFVQLQCAFVFFRRLLLYHHPDLHHFLQEQGVSPEMFCTPWFLTLFASKTPLKICLQLWDRHLKRNEPSFFVFLAVAVLANAQHFVFPAERGELPEILTSLGFGSREELERLWSAAETLHRTTPATFAARFRRTVLGSKSQAKSSAQHSKEGCTPASGKEVEEKTSMAERLLERLEQERCFFILPEELVGHCYPPRTGEVRQPWHPAPVNTWRLIVLDLRPHCDFETAHLPTALSFDPAAMPSAPSGPQGAVRRLLHWGQDGPGDGYLDPAIVFEALKATLGEDWVCDREAHICLLGSSEPEKAAMVRNLYLVLTVGLSLRHISVASGGFEAAVACAKKQGQDIITDVPTNTTGIFDPQGPDDVRITDGNRWGLNSLKSAAANATAAAAQALKKAAISASTKDDVKPIPSPREDPQKEPTCENREAQQIMPVANGVPALSKLPGNWPNDADLQSLPQRSRTEFHSALNWRCVAVAVRHPMFAKQLPSTGTHSGDPWQGCACLLWICNSHLICTLDISQQDDLYSGLQYSDNSMPVMYECEISRVQRVTSKKQAPDVVLFYFKDSHVADKVPANGSASEKVEKTEDGGEIEMVLYFSNGIADVRSFVKALRGSHDGNAGRNKKTERSHENVVENVQVAKGGFVPPPRIEAAEERSDYDES